MDVEEAEADRLRGLGYVVERQTYKAPFDLIVNGHRVDVKSAHWGRYASGNSHVCAGWIFHLHKVPATCDFYLLVCLGPFDEPVRRYVVPAAAAQIQTITIAKKGKYEPFRDAFDLLR